MIGTHPTGMPSCSNMFQIYCLRLTKILDFKTQKINK